MTRLRACCAALAATLALLMVGCDPGPSILKVQNDLQSAVVVRIDGGYQSATINAGESETFYFDPTHQARRIDVMPVDQPDRSVTYELDGGLYDQQVQLTLSEFDSE